MMKIHHQPDTRKCKDFALHHAKVKFDYNPFRNMNMDKRLLRKAIAWLIVLSVLVLALPACSSKKEPHPGNSAAIACHNKNGRVWVNPIKRFVWCKGRSN